MYYMILLSFQKKYNSNESNNFKFDQIYKKVTNIYISK
jgi:hypothetical protein